MVFSFFYMGNMAEENRVQIFINEKEIQYSHQNIVATIDSFDVVAIDEVSASAVSAHPLRLNAIASMMMVHFIFFYIL